MELRHLQALVAVTDHGTFSAAADHLGTVQSNISAHVARLESELGSTLLDRATGRLTEEGMIVVDRSRRMFAELEALVADVAACKDEVTGTVRVGMIGTTARWLAPQVLDATHRRHPGIRLVVAEGTTTALELQLVGGRLDLAVLNLPVAGNDVITVSLFDEDLVLVVPSSHPLAARNDALGIAELGGMQLLLPARGTAYREELDAAVKPTGTTLTSRADIDGLRLIASLTFEGYGPSILPATAIPGFLRSQFRGIPIAGLPRRAVGIAVRSRGLPSAPARALMDLLRSIVNSPGELSGGLHAPR